MENISDKKTTIAKFNYMFQTWSVFAADTNVEPALRKRAVSIKNKENLSDNCFVIWDPMDDSEGWLLISENADEIINETIEICEMINLIDREATSYEELLK